MDKMDKMGTLSLGKYPFHSMKEHESSLSRDSSGSMMNLTDVTTFEKLTVEIRLGHPVILPVFVLFLSEVCN